MVFRKTIGTLVLAPLLCAIPAHAELSGDDVAKHPNAAKALQDPRVQQMASDPDLSAKLLDPDVQESLRNDPEVKAMKDDYLNYGQLPDHLPAALGGGPLNSSSDPSLDSLSPLDDTSDSSAAAPSSDGGDTNFAEPGGRIDYDSLWGRQPSSTLPPPTDY